MFEWMDHVFNYIHDYKALDHFMEYFGIHAALYEAHPMFVIFVALSLSIAVVTGIYLMMSLIIFFTTEHIAAKKERLGKNL